jgi:hypothetical protein
VKLSSKLPSANSHWSNNPFKLQSGAPDVMSKLSATPFWLQSTIESPSPPLQETTDRLAMIPRVRTVSCFMDLWGKVLGGLFVG